tara:strand:+ start:446 stop:1768 length:1323 start_codon:yes stop_codon:yes gene_type:complete
MELFHNFQIRTDLTSFKKFFLEYFGREHQTFSIGKIEDKYASVFGDQEVFDSLFIKVCEVDKKTYEFELQITYTKNIWFGVDRKNLLEQLAYQLSYNLQTFEDRYKDTNDKSSDEVLEGNRMEMDNSIVQKESTNVDNIQKSKKAFEKDKLPNFIPSEANHPEGFEDNKNNILNLKYALYNHSSSIQSFFNDLDIISTSNNIFSINDAVLNLPPFDEAVYCQIVREMHRFSIAELRDKHEEQSNARSKFGLIAGGLLGILMRNPFAPFFGAQMGSNVGKSLGMKTKKIEEFLPDPNLLFFKDNYSYLSIGRSQTPKTRRIIFAPVISQDGSLFFRIIPAIVTLDYILPMQIFKMGINEYYLRPICAGINRHQKNYDAIKIHRKYYHQRIGDGISKDTEERIKVVGPDIEDIHYKLYSYQSDSQDLNYLYFDYIKQPGHVY